MRTRRAPRQVALAFLTRAPSVFAIPKASSAEHAAENAAAGDLKLSDGEIAALDKAFPRGPKPRGLPMLVDGTPFLTKCCHARRPQRISASCFRTLSLRRNWRFLELRPIRIYCLSRLP